ncbi:MAG: 5-formyltetrahydrofolate cyclo-ligase, partial [Gammaproteobacteria bacterium]
REPRDTEAMTVRELDLLLMPLVAWSRDGTRLGMGAGYYDRVLGAVEDAGQGPLRVGVAYAVQEARALPVDACDVPLHAVVTENGWVDCRQGSPEPQRTSGSPPP